MTTSVPLHILFVMSALLLIADDLFIISPHLLLVNNFFRFFQLFYLSAVFLLSHRLFTLFLRILCFLFILRLSPLFALFCFQYTGQFICRLSKMYFHLKYPAETVLILSLFRRIFYSNTVRTARLARSYILSFSCSPTAGTLYPYESVLYTGFLITLIPLLYYRKGRQ